MTLSVIRPSRKTVREALNALVQAEMVGSGKVLAESYAYPTDKLAGVTPCITFVSEPVESNIDGTVVEDPHSLIAIGAHSFVVYSDVGDGTVESPEFTEQESEDRLDLINQQFLSLLDKYKDRTNEQDPEWLFLAVGKTQVDEYTDLEGNEYKHEYFPLLLQVLNIA